VNFLGYLCAAYTAIWLGIFFYALRLGRKTRVLEAEIDELRRRLPR